MQQINFSSIKEVELGEDAKAHLRSRLASGGDLSGSLEKYLPHSQIPVTAHNHRVYDGWRAECQRISTTYFSGRYRVVDVERGFFHLIQTNQLPWLSKYTPLHNDSLNAGV